MQSTATVESETVRETKTSASTARPYSKGIMHKLTVWLSRFTKIIAILILIGIIAPLYMFMISARTTMSTLSKPVVWASPAHCDVNHAGLGWWRSTVRNFKLSTGRYDNFVTRNDKMEPITGVVVEGDTYVYNPASREYVKTFIPLPIPSTR